MKNLFIAIVVALSITSCASTKFSPPPFPQIEHGDEVIKNIAPNEIDTVLNVKTTGNLWVKINLTMVDILDSPDAVIQFSNKENGVIAGKIYYGTYHNTSDNPIRYSTHSYSYNGQFFKPSVDITPLVKDYAQALIKIFILDENRLRLVIKSKTITVSYLSDQYITKLDSYIRQYNWQMKNATLSGNNSLNFDLIRTKLESQKLSIEADALTLKYNLDKLFYNFRINLESNGILLEENELIK